MDDRLKTMFEEWKQEEEKSIATSKDSKVLIIDSLNMYIRSFAATPTMDDNGEHIGGITGFLQSIGHAIRALKPTRCVLIFDGKGGSQRRREVYKDYKGNRKTMTRLNRSYGFDTIEKEQESRVWQLKLLAELLEFLPVTVMALDNVEADDIIAYLTTLNYDRGNETIIMSTDKDFLQLVNDRIFVYNPANKRKFDENAILEQYFIHPKNFLVYRIMDGDKSDHIPGIKGSGVKTLIKHFPKLGTSELVTIEEIFKEAEQGSSKFCKTIVENEELLKRNVQLMRLDEIDISGTIKLKALDMFDRPSPQLNKWGLTKALTETKLLGAFRNYDEWILNTWSTLERYRSVQKLPSVQ